VAGGLEHPPRTTHLVEGLTLATLRLANLSRRISSRNARFSRSVRTSRSRTSRSALWYAFSNTSRSRLASSRCRVRFRDAVV